MLNTANTPVTTGAAAMRWQDLWHGMSGMSVMAFGVVIPTMMLVMFISYCVKRLTLVVLNHPLETLAELALVAMIPLVNYYLWKSICKGQVKASLKKSVACGVALSASVLTATVSIAGFIAGSQELGARIGTDFAGGFLWLTMLSMGSATASGYIFCRLRRSLEFEQSRKSLNVYVSAGAMLALSVLLASEAMPWTVRSLERSAISGTAAERKQSLDALRMINPERQMRMECGDSRAVGLCGLFLPLRSSAQHQLYFSITGKPYSFRDFNNTDLTSLPDDYVSRHVVGDKVPGLSLVRSLLSGAVHPKTLTSTMDWTFVFKNTTESSQEIRTEIGLPPQSVVTKLTVWKNGEPFSSTAVAIDGSGGSSSSYNYDGAMVSDLGHGRVLLQCQAMAEDEEIKLAVTVVSRLKPEGNNSAAVGVPHLIASNVDLDGDHQLKLVADSALKSTVSNLAANVEPAEHKVILSGDLTSEQLEGADPIITVARAANAPAIVGVYDPIATKLAQEAEEARARSAIAKTTESDDKVVVMIDGNKGLGATQIAELRKALARDNGNKQPQIRTIAPKYVIQTTQEAQAITPKHLVVVVDGSLTMKSKLKEIKSALSKLPNNIPASLIVASQEQKKFRHAMPLAKAIAELSEADFAGGQDNLQAVIQASELAGQAEGGAVLWLHGPQPVLNKEIYILTPFAAKPAFYELPVDIGPIDTYEFFKNHTEIGPFNQIAFAPKKDLGANLTGLYSRWDPANHSLIVRNKEATSYPAETVGVSSKEGAELLALHASDECRRLFARHKDDEAAKLAMAYGLVTPVTTATITSSTPAEQDNSQDASDGGSESTSLNATQSAIGPQSATEIRGVNTAGTVRVNNLANLEALLNIITNLFGIGGLIAGVFVVLQAIVVRQPQTLMLMRNVRLGTGARIAIGFAMVVVALAFPGVINWFVSSARDANLFS